MPFAMGWPAAVSATAGSYGGCSATASTRKWAALGVLVSRSARAFAPSALVLRSDVEDDIPRWVPRTPQWKSTNNRPLGTLLIGCAGPRTSTLPCNELRSKRRRNPHFRAKTH